MPDGAADPRQRTLYGRWQGHRLSARQQALLAKVLPALRVPPEGPLTSERLFTAPRQGLALEVGFGGGEHLAARAKAAPDWGFIGCEPFVNGLAQMLVRVEEGGLTNVRLHAGDARELLARLEAAALDRLYVLFPDPWPKRRHWKRRFVSPETLVLMARALKPEGCLLFASDVADYVRWTLIHVLREPAFEWLAETPRSWREPPQPWPGTRYEAKARRAGRQPVYLLFRRRSGP